MNITALRPTVMYQGQVLPPLDAIIPRIGCSHAIYGTAVVRQFEMLGVLLANDSEAITRFARQAPLPAIAGGPAASNCLRPALHARSDLSGLIDCVRPARWW